MAETHSCAKTLASADGGMGGNSILPLNAGLSCINPRSSYAKHASSMMQCLTRLRLHVVDIKEHSRKSMHACTPVA